MTSQAHETPVDERVEADVDEHGFQDASFRTGPVRPRPFDPSGGRSGSPARTSARTPVRRAAGRRRVPPGARLLLTLGVLGGLGYVAGPPLVAQARAWELSSMEQDVQELARAQQDYRAVNGRYAEDQDFAGTASLNQVTLTSVGVDSYCATVTSITGRHVWFTPATGVTTRPCG